MAFLASEPWLAVGTVNAARDLMDAHRSSSFYASMRLRRMLHSARSVSLNARPVTLAGEPATVVAASVRLPALFVPTASAAAMATAADVTMGLQDLDIDPGCARARPYALTPCTAAPRAVRTAATVMDAARVAGDQPTCARALPYSALRLTSPSSRKVITAAASGGVTLSGNHASAGDPHITAGPQVAYAHGQNRIITAATDRSPALFSPAQPGPGPSDQGPSAQTRADQQRSGLTSQQAVQQGDDGNIRGGATLTTITSGATGHEAERQLIAEDDGPSQEAMQVWQVCLHAA